jgi:glycine cleavage system H protein
MGFEKGVGEMTVPAELHYTPEHEWVAISGDVASVGITDHAQKALGDVVFVSVPAAGARVSAGEPCGEVESTKSVSDLYSPVDGEVTEVNPEIDDDPGLVNSDPYGAGWLFRVRVDESDGDTPPGLLSAAEYSALTKEEE